MTQLILFPVEIIDPAEVEPEDARLARLNAYDAWNAAYLRRFYRERAAAILASGDGVRIRLYREWQARRGTTMNRVVHCQQQPYDVYIGRANFRARLSASKWGNPFVIGKDGTREEVIAKYRAWVIQQPELMAALPELRGKVLGCWCKPAHACHGTVLVELSEQS